MKVYGSLFYGFNQIHRSGNCLLDQGAFDEVLISLFVCEKTEETGIFDSIKITLEERYVEAIK